MKIFFVALGCENRTWEKKRNSPPNKKGDCHNAKGDIFVGQNSVGEFRVKEPSKSAFKEMNEKDIFKKKRAAETC